MTIINFFSVLQKKVEISNEFHEKAVTGWNFFQSFIGTTKLFDSTTDKEMTAIQ